MASYHEVNSARQLLRDFYSSEYFALVSSFVLVGLEVFIRIVTLLLRKLPLHFPKTTLTSLATTILALCYRASRRLFNRFTPPKQRRSVIRRKCKPMESSCCMPAELTPYLQLYQHRSATPQTSSTFAHRSDITLRNMSFRLAMGTCLDYIGWDGGRERRI
jgi:hypothetical protein